MGGLCRVGGPRGPDGWGCGRCAVADMKIFRRKCSCCVRTSRFLTSADGGSCGACRASKTDTASAVRACGDVARALYACAKRPVANFGKTLYDHAVAAGLGLQPAEWSFGVPELLTQPADQEVDGPFFLFGDGLCGFVVG